MNCISWVNTAARAHTNTHKHTGYWNPLRHVAARVPGVQDDGEAELWRPPFALLCSPHRIHKHTHSYCTVRPHALSHPHTHAQRVYPLSTHAQTFTQVPPGFDGWSVSALPPVSYAYNLIWGPHGGSRTKTGLIEAVKLSYSSPSQVKSYPLSTAA